jgi:ubiquinone/menaquinone biosynthesis C-methylase UbiE
MTIFDSIGKTYDSTRQADERIVAQLVKLLDLEHGSTIADVGAGTGNYSIALAEAGFEVKAIEPSLTMRSRARRHDDVEWIAGCAEDIPLQNDSVAGVVSVLTVCHFSDPERAFREMARILKQGSIVIFAFDPEAGRETWLYEYFPFFWDTFGHTPTLEGVAEMMRASTGLPTQVIPFQLPPDLKDNFAAAGWRQPHLYLAEEYRANISSFQLADPARVDQSVKRLSADLAGGRWEELYGDVLHLEHMDAGYCFICAT